MSTTTPRPPHLFTALEQAVLEEICARETVLGAALETQLSAATVISRKNTGAGFYTDFEVTRSVAPLATSKKVIGEVWAEIAGFESPMTFLIFVADGYASCLEGATVGDSTTGVDLSAVTFTILPF